MGLYSCSYGYFHVGSRFLKCYNSLALIRRPKLKCLKLQSKTLARNLVFHGVTKPLNELILEPAYLWIFCYVL